MKNEKKFDLQSMGGYIALFFAIVLFSGIFAQAHGPLRVLDFSALTGEFGKIAGKSTFRGDGGSGARDGFLFALTLAPMEMTALGIIRVIENYGGLDAGAKLLSKILKPLLGIPGDAALALVASLSSSDTGAILNRRLLDEGRITPEERDIFASFQLPGAGLVNNYFSSGTALFPIIIVATGLPILVALITKIIGANIYRFFICRYLDKLEEKDKGVM